MKVTAKLSGVTQAKALLAGKRKLVEPTLIKSLNTTGTKARTERYVKPMNKALMAARVRKAIRHRRANKRRIWTALVPSGASVPVATYRQWGFEEAGHPTRARIWVMGVDGKKTAAGFVNPLSQHQLPLSTRYSRQKKGVITQHKYQNLQPAPGPSVAFWFKGLTTSATHKWAGDYLRDEFTRRMNAELKK